DAFMFYGLATRKIRSRMLSFRHVLEDIESLNKKATEGRYEITAISYHAYPYVSDKYLLMASGSSVGDGYGPIVVTSRHMPPEELKGKRIAIPGTMTTAFLALKLFQPDFEPVIVPFDKILEAVKQRQAAAGLVIHEGQLTYGHGGLHCVVDLGKWFQSQYGLPLPLGANAMRRDLAPDVRAECIRLLRESIEYSLAHREEALNYALQFARDMDPRLAEKFVGMYVNQLTIDGGEIVEHAAQKLLDLGYEAGLIPHKTSVEFAR
ncbi:MAG: MqnA/MqnD/SBP family protein, partial [Bryobacteraceae bacterium]